MTNPTSTAVRRRILGLAVRRAREARGRSEADVAQALEISPEEIERYERGAADLSLPDLEAISAYLEVPAEDLLTGQWAESQEIPARRARELRNKIVGALARRARLAAGKSEEEVGAELGYEPQEISQFERGLKPVPALYVQLLGQALGMPLSEFLSAPAAQEPPVVDKTLASEESLAHLAPEAMATPT